MGTKVYIAPGGDPAMAGSFNLTTAESVSGGGSDALATTGAPVDVSGAAPPVAGQVLTALDATHGIWRVAGLRYDAAVRSWLTSTGEATIEPGTWGFAYDAPAEAEGVTVFVVSSIEAPPIDSRFGLYVSPSFPKPITLALIGASQIQGLDGVLSDEIMLRPGAMYEWIFYHEGGAAIWGLVSHTAATVEPLERTTRNPPLPNQLVYSSEHDPVTLPTEQLRDGDSFALLVDTEGCVINVPTGYRLYQIDGADYVDGPSTLTTFSSSYHEWIYQADVQWWLPRESGQVSLQAVEGALSRAPGTGFNVGKILQSVSEPSSATDAATKGYVDTALAAAGGAQVKVLNASTTTFGDVNLGELGFDIAANENVVIEWFLQMRHGDAGFATFDCLHLYSTAQVGGGTPVTWITSQVQWFRGNALIANANSNLTAIGTELHSLCCASFAAEGGINTCAWIRVALNNGSSAMNLRPYVQRSTTAVYVDRGSWGRCNRGVTLT